MLQVNLNNRTALVTGGARGLGKEFTLALARSGAKVIFTSRDLNAIKNLEKEMNSEKLNGFGINLDITKHASILELQDLIDSQKVNIDILVNNAGDTLGIDYNSKIEDWMKVLDLNFLAHVNVSNLLIPKMMIKEWGRIINITSIAGLEVSGPAPFNCAKAALTAYTRSMGRLLAIENPGIVMTAIAPGIVATEGGHWEKMSRKDPTHVEDYLKHRAALKRFGTLSEISNALVFLASDHASFFHGSIIQIDGGQSRSYFPHTYL
jgi:NAD(P)-dependent dehydrogenase (short-subunit alcohol dehydrogenase family)